MPRIFNNAWIKLLALVLAALLSLYVYQVSSFPVTRTLFLPIEITNLDPSLVVLKPPMDRARLKVRGPYSSTERIKAAIIDFAGQTEPVSKSFPVVIPGLEDVEIIEQSLASVELILELKITISLPLSVDKRGKVDKNFDIGSEELLQSSIEITGPESVVERVKVAQIEPDLDGLHEDLRRSYQVLLYDEENLPMHSQLLVLRPKEVVFSVSLVPIGSIKVLKVIPAYEGQLPEDFLLDRVTPKPLYIQVDADMVPAGVFAVTTEPIDLTGVRKNFTASVALNYPFEVPAASGLAQTCEVEIEILPLVEVGGMSVQVELLGTSEEYDYIVTPPQLSLVSEELVQLDNDERAVIRARLNVEGLPPGEHRLSPQITLPLTLDRVRINPNTLTVTIIQGGE